MDLAGSRPARPSFWQLLTEGFEGFFADNALTRGAAIAFYAVTALAPVLFIAMAIAGLVLGTDAASGAVRAQLALIMSQESATLVQSAVLHAGGVRHTLLGSLLGATVLVITASGVFTEIEDALNVIWKAPRKESYLHQLLRGRVVSLALVVGLGVLLVASMILASAIGSLGERLERHAAVSHLITGVLDFVLSFTLLWMLFAAIYKLLPNKKLHWRDVLAGAGGTALLFQAGQVLVSFYLANFLRTTIYGAAAGVIVLLVWVYCAAMIFLLGAEFTKVWACHFGSAGSRDAPGP
jgi:membrane protein